MPASPPISRQPFSRPRLAAALTSGALLAAAASPVQAADMAGERAAMRTHVRPVTVTRVATVTDCQPRPTIVAPGRPGMGQPGTYLAIWDWRVPRVCQVNPYR